MKLHIPIALLSALFGSLIAQSVEIPVDYELVELHSTDDLNSYASNTSDDKYAFILDSDLTFTPAFNTSWNSSTSLVNGGDLLFVAAESDELIALSFDGGSSSAFNRPSSLCFDSLSELNISNHIISGQSAVINLGTNGKLYIKNIKIGNQDEDAADVIFFNNKTTSSYGGAVYANGASTIIDISHNGNIKFVDNGSSVASSAGGSIYSKGDVIINQNNDVIFDGNTASSGGAIYSTGKITINDNEKDVNFVKNSATGNVTEGGAISSNGVIEIKGNMGKVCFSENQASSSSYSAKGGALYSNGSVNIINNKDVIFTNNFSSATARKVEYPWGYPYYDPSPPTYYFYLEGGAIYSSGLILMQGNASVRFEKNYERDLANGDIYRLRSIYMSPNASSDSLILSAKADGHIIFYDSVYMGNCSGATASLNNDYEDANGISQKATGDIIFSGKYTEEHLKEVKGGVAGTSTEIENSRTSSLLNTVNLYGGTLRVEDKAVLKTHAINVAADGNATMKVLDAEVNASTYDVTINSTGQLTLGGTDGSAKLTAKNININQGATLSAERTEVPEATPSITLAAEETVSIFNEKLGGVASGNLNLAAGSAYRADGAHLSVIKGTLTLRATADEKINLGLTVGAEYAEDSKVLLFTDVGTVKFVLDNITTTSTGALKTFNAIDYFCGEWINENTELVYEAGTLYLVGVNRVIPEPTTATLSLLALAGLVARRRRK